MTLHFVIGLSAGMSDERVIRASEVEAKIMAGEPARFDNRIITGELNLYQLKIERPVYFNNTTFQDLVNFEKTIFNGSAYFREAAFNRGANFMGSKFNRDANFMGSKFNSGVNPSEWTMS